MYYMNGAYNVLYFISVNQMYKPALYNILKRTITFYKNVDPELPVTYVYVYKFMLWM